AQSLQPSGRRALPEALIRVALFGLAKAGRGETIRANARHPIGRRSGRSSMKSMLRISAVTILLAGSAVALTGERMPQIPLEQMTPAQRAVAESIMAGPRGGKGWAFKNWLDTPGTSSQV